MKLRWQTRWLIWRWAIVTYGVRKAFRLYRHGVKVRALRRLGDRMNFATCPRCGRIFRMKDPDRDPLKFHYDYCEGYQEFDDESIS